MTKFGTYGISRDFNRKTFYTKQPRRCNYVHQRVRFKAYLVIAYGGIENHKKSNIELYFGEGYTAEHQDDYKAAILQNEKK